MATLYDPYSLPPVPPVTEAGLKDPVWARWLNLLRDAMLLAKPVIGSFYSTATFSALALTPSLLTFNSTVVSNGVTLGAVTSRLYVNRSGVYNLQFSAQTSNTGAAVDDVTLWTRVNGVNVADSAGFVGVPAKHGATDGHICCGWNQYLSLSKGDYVELMWMTAGGTTTIETYPASGVPSVPRIPSVVVSLEAIQ